eukprot:364100-Chlamydomonas_euryale.AAC.19
MTAGTVRHMCTQGMTLVKLLQVNCQPCAVLPTSGREGIKRSGASQNLGRQRLEFFRNMNCLDHGLRRPLRCVEDSAKSGFSPSGHGRM